MEKKESRRVSNVQGPTPRFSIEVDPSYKNGLLMLEQYCTLTRDLTEVSLCDGRGDVKLLVKAMIEGDLVVEQMTRENGLGREQC